MTLVRRAVPGDAKEVLRLRQVMIDSMPHASPATDWHADSLPVLRARPAETDGTFAAFVVDHPDRPGSAALAAGTIDYCIGGAYDPHGIDGYQDSSAGHRRSRRW